MTATSSLTLASDQFCSTAGLVTDDQWTLPTPCPDWNVHALVGHVASGSQMCAAVVLGATREEAMALLGTDFLGDDPLTALDRALAGQIAAFDEAADDLDRICQHPAGDMPAAQILGFRILDLLVHRWDLLRALGGDETLDPGLVEEVWTAIQPMVPIIGQVGVFGSGPSGDLGTDAPLQDRLLDVMGRRP